MDLLAVVRKAQSLSRADVQGASLCGLKPFWVDGSTDAEVGNGDLVTWLGAPFLSDYIKFRSEEEERLAAELNQRAGDCSSIDKLLRPYLEQVIEPNPNPNPNSDRNAIGHQEKKQAAQTPFNKLLKKASPLLGQTLQISILRAFCSSRNWESVRVMLDSHAVNGNTHPELVSLLIEHDQASLLCMWIRVIQDPRFSDLRLILKYFLKTALRAGKSLTDVSMQWRRAALGAIQRISEMKAGNKMDLDKKYGDEETQGGVNGTGHTVKKDAKENAISRAVLLAAAVDNFQPFEVCLHYFVASGHDEAVLASIISQLDSMEVLKLLGYLKKWLQKYSKQGSLCTCHTKRKDLWVPSFGEVLQWISVLIDVHLTALVLGSDFHGEILSVQAMVKDLVDVGHKLTPLVGVTEHLQMKGPLPMPKSSGGEDDHVIEYLEF